MSFDLPSIEGSTTELPNGRPDSGVFLLGSAPRMISYTLELLPEQVGIPEQVGVPIKLLPTFNLAIVS
jgi:hypothetical protein